MAASIRGLELGDFRYRVPAGRLMPSRYRSVSPGDRDPRYFRSEYRSRIVHHAIRGSVPKRDKEYGGDGAPNGT